ncbi:MOSC N-terminal beta barrel domain-containing protein [Streptomyces sp. INA 01156]
MLPHSIHVRPVRAFRSLSLREVSAESWGPTGDRPWMPIDDRGGSSATRASTPRPGRRRPSGRRRSPACPRPERIPSRGPHTFGPPLEQAGMITSHDSCAAGALPSRHGRRQSGCGASRAE